MATAAEQGRDTRLRLMGAATELIAERGWSAVTTRLVAERAGVRPGVVHYHFPTVDDLLVDAALRLMGSLTAEVPGASEPGGIGIPALLSVVGEYSQPGADTRIFAEILLAATRHERLRIGLARVLTEFRSTLSDTLRADAVTEPETTAAVLVAALDGLVLHRLIDPQVREMDVTSPLLRLCGTDPSQKEKP